MLWLKNLMIYRLQSPLEKDYSQLEKKLANFAFVPCGPQEKIRIGWIPPMGSHQKALIYEGNGHILICANKEEKLLPAFVIQQAFEKKIEKLEAQQQRQLKKTEKASLKEAIFYDFLPRAFSRFQNTFVWIDTIHQLLTLDTSSAKKAEEILALLRQSLGSLPIVPLRFEHPVEWTLTEWIRSAKLPPGFTLMQEAELKSTDPEGGTIRCKNQDLYSDEVALQIESGKKVTQLALEWQARIQLVLNQNLCIKRLKFLDILREQNEHIDKKDLAQRFDADFILITDELREFIQNMINALGGDPK